MALLRLLSLPVRAPFLTLLFCVAVVLGNHWSLVMRQFSLLIAYSRFMTLVVNLFVVVTVGIYVLFLNLLSDLLVLTSAVLLARLDLARIGISLRPSTSGLLMAVIVFSGIGLGHLLPNPVLGWFAKNLVFA